MKFGAGDKVRHVDTMLYPGVATVSCGSGEYIPGQIGVEYGEGMLARRDQRTGWYDERDFVPAAQTVGGTLRAVMAVVAHGER